MRPYRLIFYFFKCYLDRVQYRLLVQPSKHVFWNDIHYVEFLSVGKPLLQHAIEPPCNVTKIETFRRLIAN